MLTKWFFDIDKFTLCFALSLICLGLIMSASVSPAMASRLHMSNPYHFTLRHVFFASLSLCTILLLSMFSRISILNISYLGLFACIALLGICYITGGSIKGAKRWIHVGFFTLQPSDIMKPFFIVMNAHFLSISKTNRFAPMISVFMLLGILCLLIIQPDFGMSVMYSAIWLVQIFLGSANIWLLSLSIAFAGILLGVVGFFFFPHFHYRVMNFFTLRAGHEQYQTKKAIESIYNGGFLGTGLGEGEVKYQLPDAHTDYIFATICEELGVIFAILLMFSYMIFVYRHVVSNFMNSKYNIRVIYGLVFSLVLQSCLHIGVNLNFLPSKGITLPFVSYGGSSLLSSGIIMGFLLAFTRKQYNYNSPYKFFEEAYIQKNNNC